MKHIGLKAVLIAASFLVCSPAFAQDKESQIAKGIEFHNRSRTVEGNESDSLIDNCINTLEPFIKENSLACDNPLARAPTPGVGSLVFLFLDNT